MQRPQAVAHDRDGDAAGEGGGGQIEHPGTGHVGDGVGLPYERDDRFGLQVQVQLGAGLRRPQAVAHDRDRDAAGEGGGGQLEHPGTGHVGDGIGLPYERDDRFGL